MIHMKVCEEHLVDEVQRDTQCVNPLHGARSHGKDELIAISQLDHNACGCLFQAGHGHARPTGDHPHLVRIQCLGSGIVNVQGWGGLRRRPLACRRLGRFSRGILNRVSISRVRAASPADVMPLPMTNRRLLVLRRTVDYLEAKPNSPITVHELTQVVGAGVRTLEYVFRDYFDVTLKVYLTTRRFIGARRELQRSNADSTRIGDVAITWGFWHLSRFSADYRKFFGELPSQTLRQN